jgi:hypothetical protein
MKQSVLVALLSFNGGFVDTAGFLGLQGLFTAHVTGNFVTLGATLVFGTNGVIAKLLALPEFMLVIALAHVIGAALTKHGLPTLRLMLAATTLLLGRILCIGRLARALREQRCACRPAHRLCRARCDGNPECRAARPPRQPAAKYADDRQYHSGGARSGRSVARPGTRTGGCGASALRPHGPQYSLFRRGLRHCGSTFRLGRILESRRSGRRRCRHRHSRRSQFAMRPWRLS